MNHKCESTEPCGCGKPASITVWLDSRLIKRLCKYHGMQIRMICGAMA